MQIRRVHSVNSATVCDSPYRSPKPTFWQSASSFGFCVPNAVASSKFRASVGLGSDLSKSVSLGIPGRARKTR